MSQIFFIVKIIVHQRRKKQPRRIKFFRYDEWLLLSTWASMHRHFEQHQDKTSHVESICASNRTMPKIKNPYLRPNHRAETKPPPIFISTKQNKNKR